MGTVELTGLVMMHTMADGQALADASHRLFTMPALVLKRSSRVIPVGRMEEGSHWEVSRVTRLSALVCTPLKVSKYKLFYNGVVTTSPLLSVYQLKSTWFSGHTSRYHDHLAPLQRLWQLLLTDVPLHTGRSVHMAEVCRHTYTQQRGTDTVESVAYEIICQNE